MKPNKYPGRGIPTEIVSALETVHRWMVENQYRDHDFVFIKDASQVNEATQLKLAEALGKVEELEFTVAGLRRDILKSQ